MIVPSNGFGFFLYCSMILFASIVLSLAACNARLRSGIQLPIYFRNGLLNDFVKNSLNTNSQLETNNNFSLSEISYSNAVLHNASNVIDIISFPTSNDCPDSDNGINFSFIHFSVCSNATEFIRLT